MAARLRLLFPEGFIYVGASHPEAAEALSNQKPSSSSGLQAGSGAGTACVGARGKEFDGWETALEWISLLRLHHWSKNLLVLVPLFLSQQFLHPESVTIAAWAFLAFGLMTSGTYIINDLADIPADRAHPVKRMRPLAAGTISLTKAMLASMLLVGIGAGLSIWLSAPFGAVVAGYLGLTLAYTFGLKRVPFLDTFVVGILLALRVVAGMVLLGTPLSGWLISFSIALFSSLAMAKRYAELYRIAAARSRRTTGRGYSPADLPTLLAFGVGCAIAALVIVIVYVSVEVPFLGLYRSPGWLYVMPVVLMSWLSRIWQIARRGELNDDPVVFALSDVVSWLHGAACVLIWILAISV